VRSRDRRMNCPAERYCPAGSVNTNRGVKNCGGLRRAPLPADRRGKRNQCSRKRIVACCTSDFLPSHVLLSPHHAARGGFTVKLMTTADRCHTHKPPVHRSRAASPENRSSRKALQSRSSAAPSTSSPSTTKPRWRPSRSTGCSRRWSALGPPLPGSGARRGAGDQLGSRAVLEPDVLEREGSGRTCCATSTSRPTSSRTSPGTTWSDVRWPGPPLMHRWGPRRCCSPNQSPARSTST